MYNGNPWCATSAQCTIPVSDLHHTYNSQLPPATTRGQYLCTCIQLRRSEIAATFRLPSSGDNRQKKFLFLCCRREQRCAVRHGAAHAPKGKPVTVYISCRVSKGILAISPISRRSIHQKMQSGSLVHAIKGGAQDEKNMAAVFQKPAPHQPMVCLGND